MDNSKLPVKMIFDDESAMNSMIRQIINEDVSVFADKVALDFAGKAYNVENYIFDKLPEYMENYSRAMKFKFKKDINSDMLFETMQPVLVKKYGMQIEKNDNGITITHGGYIYDVIINQDSTFVIWWRMGLGKAFAPKSKYKSYKTFLAAMGIIAFEVQESFEIE